MPIKGISEVIRLCRLGKIKLGIKKETDGEPYPEATDYFVCPEEVKRIFGEKPRELRIMFPTNDPAQWASQYYRRYSESGRLICRGDGKIACERVENWLSQPAFAGETRVKEIQCNPTTCEAYQQGLCRHIMILEFLIPACPGFGIYQLWTTSYHSMANVNSTLGVIREYCGRLAMIPFSLHLVEKDVQPQGQNKTCWVLNLAPTYSLSETLRYALQSQEKVLVVPHHDDDIADDLFPGPASKPNSTQERQPFEEELLQLWAKVKSKIFHYCLQEYQVASFFEKNYRLEVGLRDFDSPAPPAKFTATMLSDFLRDIERHTRFS